MSPLQLWKSRKPKSTKSQPSQSASTLALQRPSQDPSSPTPNPIPSHIENTPAVGSSVKEASFRVLEPATRPATVADTTNMGPALGGDDRTSSMTTPSFPALDAADSSSLYSSIVVATAGGKSSGQSDSLVSTGFQGLKTMLKLIERAGDAFPPLKSTVGGLLGLIDLMEVRNFMDH